MAYRLKLHRVAEKFMDSLATQDNRRIKAAIMQLADKGAPPFQAALEKPADSRRSLSQVSSRRITGW